jgi:flagellar biosynthesis anti-sigma factor FlgM
MSIEKILPQPNGAASTQRPLRSLSLGADQKAALATAPTSTHPSALDAVRISSTAKEMLQAVQGSPEDETFDRDKVEQIRREIAEGRFVIDEDRVARKFRELEEQLGDLG